MYLNLIPAARYTFSDLPEEEAIRWASTFPGHSAITFMEKLTYPAYKHIPVAYLLCKGDRLIHPDVQRSFIDHVSRESGREAKVYACDSGHCPNISRPDYVVDVVRHAAGEMDVVV